MKRLITILSLLSMPLLQMAAQVSIEQCQEKARRNYPLIKRYELIKKTEEFTLSNANKGYLPQLSVAAKASYQSDVTKVPIAMPGVDIPTMSKDQYSAEVHLSQTIWDGGIISNKKDMAIANSEANTKELETNIYQIKNRVNELYFGILLIDAQLERNSLYQQELGRNSKRVSNYIAQGVANQSDLDVVQVEILNTKQSHAQLSANKKAFVEMLSHFVGEEIKIDETFNVPRYDNKLLSNEIKRPELAMYEAKARELEAQRKNINASLTPKFELFATGGYGRPGFNMLKDKFGGYYMVGARMAWNFGSLYTRKNDNKMIDAAKENMEVMQETFIFNTQMEMKQEDNSILKNRELLKHDDEIIKLRTNIRKTAEIKLENGTISTTDFMREATAEDVAKQNKIEHEMQLLMTIYKHRYISNNK